jgi:DNA-binding beta-propeller fold protein YncE
MLAGGDVLVSNFNNSGNAQGTGSTIVRITKSGAMSVFFQGPKTGVGLSTALGALRRGFVLVGNVPTTDGSCSTIQQGSLLVIDRTGTQVASLANASTLDGPWDLTIHDEGDHAQVFVSDVLSGTVVRLDVSVSEHNGVQLQSATQIASGYLHRCDPNALVVGPTGLAYDAKDDVLYVASTGDNEIFAIANARKTSHDTGMGTLVYQDDAHLRGPLALALGSGGHLLTANGDAVNTDPTHPSELVEFTKDGKFVAQMPVDTGGIGGAFGLALKGSDDEFRLAAVDDINNTLDVWIVR